MEFTLDAYNSLIEDIFRRFPSVQKDGFTAGAYKPGLDRMLSFDRYLGYPSRQFKSIHIAGTNGKGSVANLVASALQSCGLSAGLFTSPHILDFRERIRVNGLIPVEYVFKQLTSWMPWIVANDLSFFEITTGLAFKYFADSGVDYAVIETGLGGRLDSTNILEKPEIIIVTSIGFDHMALLGDTLPKIAAEKAGIFKEGVPALIGEALPETRPVFEARANGFCPLYFAEEMDPSFWDRRDDILSKMDLGAEVQRNNLRTVLSALQILGIHDESVLNGIIHAARNMEFHGRWERLQKDPLVIADIGHNAHALRHNFAQLEAMNRPLIIVYGIMADKDLDAIIPLMPRRAKYIFTSPATPRALPAGEIARRFAAPAIVIDSVQDAVRKALELSSPDTIIYIGGSTFVVSEALPLFE
ncbi:MAG: bifunctional folylpolyglutamate synthase/dihydrofolate synthase [Bacteroidales bacterium]|nr:bifunctional folylpolyglutamate synthase/dihydrofolate synthase [Bacteroidales bacterium]